MGASKPMKHSGGEVRALPKQGFTRVARGKPGAQQHFCYFWEENVSLQTFRVDAAYQCHRGHGINGPLSF